MSQGSMDFGSGLDGSTTAMSGADIKSTMLLSCDLGPDDIIVLNPGDPGWGDDYWPDPIAIDPDPYLGADWGSINIIATASSGEGEELQVEILWDPDGDGQLESLCGCDATLL